MPEDIKKEIASIKTELSVQNLSPRIINVFIKNRSDKTNYITAGNTKACDVMLDIEWQGKRYRLPAFEV